MSKRSVIAFLSAGALLITLTSADASTIAMVEAQPSATTGQTIDGGAVVTAVLSQPGVVNGRNYSSWAFTINDGSGSMHVYANGPVLTALGYAPTVGDIISVTGTYSPYHQIPELITPTAISLVGSGGSVPPPLVRNISQINQSPLPLDLGGYLIRLDDVTITGQGTTFTAADGPLTATITDSSGTMTFYHWPGTFSAINTNLFGQPVPTEPVSIVGLLSVYTTGVTEFHALSIVPEPAAGALLVLGALPLLRRRRV